MGHGQAPQVNVNLSRTIPDYAKMRQMQALDMRALIFAVIAVFAGLTSAAAQFLVPQDCREGPAEVSIAACTKFLANQKLTTEERAAALMRRGEAYVRDRNPDAAVQDYDASVKLNPKSGLAYGLRGIALRMQGEYDKAIDSYNIAIKLQPDVAIRYSNRGIVYRLKGDLDKAMADFNKAVSMKIQNPRTFVERATVYRLKLDYDRALADNNRAVMLDSEFAGNFAERALTHEARNDFKAALADFRKAQSLAPKSERIARAIDRIEGKIANPDQARQPPVDPKQTAAKQPDAKQPDPKQAQKVQVPASRAVGQRVALVIGNSSYGNVAPLSNPKNDAEALSKALRGVGFTNVMLKLDLNREQLAATLKEFAALADKAEWAVIYYAGHGIEVGGNNYLVPVDAKFSSDRDVTFEAVTLEQVLQSVEGASKLRLVILDACRDNPFVKKMVKSSGTRSIGKGLGNIEPEGATLVAYAAKHGQTAEDGQGGNSPFATALIKQIQTPGQEINLVFRKVRDEVLAATGKRQEPFTYGSLPSEAFYFKTN
jgi:tetratricopeptide (TPR) repeat protein